MGRGRGVIYVDDEQIVWAPFPELGGWLRCTVQAAMGNTARVVNEKRNVDTWFYVDELHAEKPAPGSST